MIGSHAMAAATASGGGMEASCGCAHESVDTLNQRKDGDDEARRRIDAIVEKYAQILGVDHKNKPQIVFADNLGSRWLAHDRFSFSRPETTTITIQRRVLGDERTLERVVAHEMVHHAEAVSMSADDLERMRAGLLVGIRPDAHGKDFLERAARVNAVMGPDFVTVKSDQAYVESENERPYELLIVPVTVRQGEQTFGFAWAARIGHAARPWVDAKIRQGAVLTTATSRRWTIGQKIKRFGSLSLPRNDEEKELLREMFEDGGGILRSENNERANGDELTIEHLKEALRKAGEKETQQFHETLPFIGYVEGDGETIRGRFFPSRNAILVMVHSDDEITRATVNHELAHAIRYRDDCGGTTTVKRSKCGYHGEHDDEFYRVLEPMHRSTGISPRAARAVEGSYKYPKSWNEEAWA